MTLQERYTGFHWYVWALLDDACPADDGMPLIHLCAEGGELQRYLFTHWYGKADIAVARKAKVHQFVMSRQKTWEHQWKWSCADKEVIRDLLDE